MATAVASRFAVLCDDVDDDYSNRKRQPQPRKIEQSAAPVTKTAAKKKKNKENSQPQANKPKPKAKADNSQNVKKKTVEEPSPPQQWEQWKVKDEQLAAVTYKDDLSKALALSKLDYEQKKEFYIEQSKTAQPPVPSQPPDTEKKGKKKNKTIKVLSVEEFHNLGKVIIPQDSPPVVEPPKPDPEFFQRLEAEINLEVSKRAAPSVKSKKSLNVRQPLDDDALNLAQLRDKLDKKTGEMDILREENNILKEENNTLKDDLKSVKTRNKTLCHILANGEMKDKAEILMEVERLQTMRDELSEQVASLVGQLEQERSRVRALSNDKTSNKTKKKRTNSSGDN